MPKTAKKGFTYFRFETDHFYDPKVKKLKNKYGMEGWAVYHFIVNEIYRVEGCYMLMDSDALFDISDYSRMEEERISEIISFCAELGLFNKELWQKRQILTSTDIQELYVGICKTIHRKPSISPDICLYETEPERKDTPVSCNARPDVLPEKSSVQVPAETYSQTACRDIREQADIPRENKPHKIKEKEISSPTPPQTAGKNEEDFLSRELKYMGVPSAYISWISFLKGYYPELPVEKAIEDIKGSGYCLTTANYLLPLIDNYIAKYNAEYGRKDEERRQKKASCDRQRTLDLLGIPAKVQQEILQLGSIAPVVLDATLKETWGNKKIKSPTRFILSRMRQAVPA
ncbi:DUF4373 domain-containing protein [Phocaeicola coprocola]|uniref:DUF4373 domain-containing protein n=1 Tax=Phocaeicola coprocola TaxID=310298 RepID=UPI002675788F|nr:DUF4373 domain-containing protein [Phocaeicola coprocola]